MNISDHDSIEHFFAQQELPSIDSMTERLEPMALNHTLNWLKAIAATPSCTHVHEALEEERQKIEKFLNGIHTDFPHLLHLLPQKSAHTLKMLWIKALSCCLISSQSLEAFQSYFPTLQALAERIKSWFRKITQTNEQHHEAFKNNVLALEKSIVTEGQTVTLTDPLTHQTCSVMNLIPFAAENLEKERRIHQLRKEEEQRYHLLSHNMTIQIEEFEKNIESICQQSANAAIAAFPAHIASSFADSSPPYHSKISAAGCIDRRLE